jgi:hypothetical protein
MKFGERKDLLDVFLDYRVDVLVKCFAPLSGWRNGLKLMVSLLDDPKSQYEKYLEKRREENNKGDDDPLTFEEFLKKTFCSIHEQLKFCMVNLYTHLPTSLIQLEVVKEIIRALDLLKSLETGLQGVGVGYWFTELSIRKECLRIMRCLTLSLTSSIPNFTNNSLIKNFCLANACLVFSTASSSAKLYSTEGSMEFLVIDEAAQLKECETAIPLQLSDVRHAILIGDETQLPPLVKSEVKVLSLYWFFYLCKL